MDQKQIDELTVRVRDSNAFAHEVLERTGKIVLGSERLTASLLRAILSGGHVLLEGLPGLAKTLLAETFAALLDADFKRIQFTPDLLPTDLTGGEVLDTTRGQFYTRKGPVFTNILLADEINRAPAKVQSALLECMGEKKVTIGGETHALEEPYLVMATQNPIEQEGTYPLPEAQTDRFMFKVIAEYPSRENELQMLEVHAGIARPKPAAVVKKSDIIAARSLCETIYADERLRNYIVDLTRATRKTEDLDESLRAYIDYGASPRASLALLRGARANAFIEGRGFAIPEDVREVARETLRHRILLGYTALAEDVDVDTVINTVLQKVPVP